MSRYTGPVYRKARRLGFSTLEKHLTYFDLLKFAFQLNFCNILNCHNTHI